MREWQRVQNGAHSGPAIQPQAGVPLAPLTTLGVGGPARWFVRATTADAVAAADRWARDESLPMFVLGGGSNLVIADAGFDGLVVQIAIGGIEIGQQGAETVFHVGAGELWDDVVAAAVARGLAGLECLSGIPGSVGGTPVQNVGAYGQEVSDTIREVTVFDRAAVRVTTLSGDECGFAYRTSRFKGNDAGRFVICDVRFALRSGPPTVTYPDLVAMFAGRSPGSVTLHEVREAVLAIRRRKGMVVDESDPDTRSVGSFFMNPIVTAEVHARLAAAAGSAAPGFPTGDGRVKIPAAWLIERAGFARGHRRGRAGVSSKHPLALVNLGGATSRDVLALAVEIKRRVSDRFGMALRPEPAFVGFDHDPDVAYLTEA
ncbi:MAG: UDP-N-acetylmuramate dehydrogenase [Acidobacteria bacterium]|nr:UDP-N-acetylmuramate dehydrogenase [Acidobacteriota bacterium]